MATQMSILNPHPRKLPGPTLLHQLVRRDVNDDTPALDYQDKLGSRHIITYQTLHDQSDTLASNLHTLREHSGLFRTDRFIVPVFIGQCPELYITQLAILKAGGAFCPITLDVPEERLRFILKDASAAVLVTTSELRDRLPPLENVSVVVADQVSSEQDFQPPQVEIEATMPAYVMYTSGSTGQPKGVLLSHSAATQALLAHDRHIPAFSRFLQFASPTFDVSVFEIFFPLFRGCTLVVCDRTRMLNDLAGTINALNVDAAELTPSVANSLLQGRGSVPGLKVLLTIGEMLKQSVVEDFGGSDDEVAVLHGMYGPTEATIHCTLQPEFGKDMPVNNIGIPLDTVSAFVVRPASEEHPSHLVEILPAGEEGELAVGGHQLADGYLNREEQTRAAFVSHPEFGQLYRTGDRAKLDPQQRLMCLGRISSGQVKLRGQRIELGEIEYAASRTPGCRDVVADVISDTLVAFCVSSSSDLSENSIQETCRKWLPPYMVPMDVLLLESMPYLASGKIDRRTLQDLHKQFRTLQDQSSTQEIDEDAKHIAKVFEDVLKVDVLRLPSLSAAGIDSLSSIRIASKLRHQGYPLVDATDILEARSLSDLHRRLVDSNVSDSHEALPKASLMNTEGFCDILQTHDLLSSHISKIQDVIACTPIQSAMLGETAKDPRAYCNWIKLQIDVERSIEDIEEAVLALVSHHDMLRAGFAAMHNVKHPYASIIWKKEEHPGLRHITAFEYDFVIDSDSELFRPRPIQIRRTEDGTNVLLQLHHSLYDQWSVDVIKSDLDTLIQGQCLPSRPSYALVSAFHAQKHDEASLEAGAEYWQTHLQDATATPLPQLNGKRASPVLQRTAWLPVDIPTATLKETATNLNSSAPAILQAAYAYILSLYTGTSDVLYGTVYSGRHIPVPGIEHIIGPCLATLPARVDTQSVRTCKDLIRVVHDQNRNTMKHSGTPLAEVKKIGKSAPNEAMFDTLFVWQESTFVPPTLVAEIDSADQHELNLVLEAEPRADKLALRITYQQGRISSQQVDLLVAQMQCVVQQFMEHPEGAVVDLTRSLPAQIMAIDNPHAASHPHKQGLVATLEEVADRMPSAPALIFGQSLAPSAMQLQTLSYGEMHSQANKLARHLVAQQVQPDDLVCVCMDKSIQLYVAILAVLKSGAGYLPLLPDTPRDRLSSILDQTTVKTFLCDSSVPADVRSAVDVTIIDLADTELAQYADDNLKLPYNGSHAAYSIFTSGSTGTPKGLIVTQDNLLGNLSTLADIYPTEPGSRLLQACSQAFDVSVFEIFFAFFTGMPLCFARKDDLFQDIEHGIRALEITHLSLTPTVATLVIPENVPSVRFLVTAGEAMTDIVHRRWAGKGLHQGYGPSETTNICTVNPQMPSSDIISNIGPAFPNTSAFVINPIGPFEILPFGAVGELAFGGEQVFRGYIGRDELNKEKIIEHPAYGRVYRSGDIGRMLPDGTIIIIGRLDDQVKVRGNRVELGEINASLLHTAWVEDCTTMVLGKEAASQSIATFWIPASEAADDFRVVDPTRELGQRVSELYRSLENSLPPYMIPAAIVPVTTLPRTTQGKLDRRRLESAASTLEDSAKNMYFRSAGHAQDDDATEWTSSETELADALANATGLAQADVGRNTSFFALGLNSINAIAYAKAIEKRLGQTVAVGAILRNASVARLARFLSAESQQCNGDATDAPMTLSPAIVDEVREKYASSQHEIAEILPCTPLQESMLSTDASKSNAAYSNVTTFKVAGDLARLKDCFKTLVARHSILRTVFYETTDPDHPYAQIVLDHIDLPWTSNNDLDDEGVKIGPSHPFQVATSDSDEETFLMLHMHHAIYDGTSMSVLLEEAEMLYHSQSLPKAPSFQPFLAEVQKQAGPDSLAFWSSYVQGFSANPFPRQANGTVQQSSDCIEAPLTATTKEIEDFTRRHNVSSASLFQAAWAKVLYISQSADDVCFGDVVSGRSVPVASVDRLVAPCFNTLPVRANLDQYHDNIGLVRALHKQRLAVDSHQLTPLRRIQAHSKTPSVHLFDSLVLVQPPSQELDPGIWEITNDEGLMDLPLVLEIAQGSMSSQLMVHFDTTYFSHDKASLLANAFVNSLGECLQYPSGNVRDLSDNQSQHLQGILATELVSEDIARPEPDGTPVETWNESEQLVRQAFSYFAKVDEIKIQRHTSLYRLGLDSLHAVQVASRLRSKGFAITAADVMEHRTPAALAIAASSAIQADANDSMEMDLAKYDSDHRSKLLQPLHISAEAVESLRPCTAAQNGMISQSLQSNGRLYVNHISHAVPDGVGVDELRSAWQRVQRKHQALRMGFAQTEDGNCPFAMVIYRSSETSVPFEADTPDESGISATLVGTLHRPAWRVTVDLASHHRTMTLSIHHALYDAESLQLLLSGFDHALRLGDIGTTPSIDNMLRPMLTGSNNVGSEAERFWRKSLENASLTPFPNLNPVVTAASDLYSTQRTSSTPQQALEHMCKARGCTIQAAGQSAWALLLSAYTGEAAVTFGTVFSGRTGSQNDSVVFPSLTTVPVFCNTAGGGNQVLADMTNFNGAAQRHRFVPLSDIQRYAELPGQSLFDTVFVYQKSTSDVSGGFSWPLLKQSAAVDYNVSIELETSTAGDVSLTLTANRGILPEEHACLLLQQYDHLLAQVLHGESKSTASSAGLYSITPAQCPILPSPVPLLHQFVEEGARKWPERAAMEFAWDLDNSPKSRPVWSYRQLNERANQVARLLQGKGAKPGDIVAVCMQKCPEASFAFIGILKAGCAFLALDPELPSARRQFILDDSGATVLLVDQSSEVEDRYASTAIVELNDGNLDTLSSSLVDVGVIDPQATCYCLYTSGTTGTPKGCELTHENAIQAMMSFQTLFAGRWNSNSRWLQFASYWFDVSVLEQFWSWSVGITLVGAPRDLVLDDLTLFLQQLQITHIDLTPSLARILEPEDVPSLWDGVFITGGEALKQEIIEKWGSHRTICNGYGPTEATIGVTMNPFIGPDAKASNIGPAFLNVGSYVFVPATTDPVLRGAVGELCVTGKLVGKGYLNRPELTAKAFPTLERTGEKFYRTGDLVRQTADGSFLFIGRQDSQAKLRGQRLEIDEIDSVIKSSSSSIADVASLVIKSPKGDKETLVTFFITAVRRQTRDVNLELYGDSREAAHAALESCRAHLPGYMVPTHIIPLNIIPLTVNNKIDAKRLTAFYNELTVSSLQKIKGDQASKQALGETEKKICDVLKRMIIVDLKDVDRDTSIFSVGLSSVSAITFATMLKRSGFPAANVALIMRNSTIGQLADALSKGAINSQDRNLVQQAQMSVAAFNQRHRPLVASRMFMRTEDVEVVVPGTPLQQGLILESLRSAESPYFNAFNFDATQLDLDRLQAAFQQVADLAEPLRAQFLQTDDGYAMVVQRRREVPWFHHRTEKTDSTITTSQHRRQWVARNQHELLSPFEVAIVGTPSTTVLTVFIHHSLYDGISFDKIMDRVSQAYHGRGIDCGPKFTEALPFGPLRPAKDAETFWSNHLSSNSHDVFPVLSQSLAESDPVETHVFGKDVNPDRVSRSLGVAHQAVAQAGFIVALHQLAPSVGRYGMVVSGRSIAFDGADEVLGPLFNTIPAPILLQADDTWATLTQRCHDFNVGALPYQHTSLRDVKKWCKFAPSDPVFNVLFVFQNAQATATSGSSIWQPLEDAIKAEYPLSVEVDLNAEGDLSATVVARHDIANAATLRHFLQHFHKSLKSMDVDAQARIAEQFQISATAPTSKVASNGDAQHTHSLNGVQGFSWTPDANIVRSEIATLASLEESEIDEHATIFSLGLDSIDAVKLTSRLKKRGINIPMSKLLRVQPIPQIVSSLDTATQSNGVDATKPNLERLEKQLCNGVQFPYTFDKTLIERLLPATPSQEALIAEMIRSNFHEYYNHDVLHLTSDIDVERLQHAWSSVIKESPILRTTFVEVSSPEIDAVYAQGIHRAQDFSFSRIEADDAAGMDKAIENIRDEARRSLSASPPTRLTLIEMASERYLILSLAHAQYDGHSLALIHQDVERAYFDQPRVARPTPEVVIEASLAAVNDQALSFWRNALSGARVCHFPRNDTRWNATVVHRVESVGTIDARKARAFCQSTGVSLQSLAQTSWALTLAHYTQRLEAVFGAVLACRDSEEAEQILFPMMNTVAMRATLHGTRREMLKYMQDVNTDVLAYQRTPLRFIQSAAASVARSEPCGESTGLFDTLFIYQHRPDTNDQQTKPLYESVGGSSSIEYPVAVEMEAVGDNLIFRAACKDSVLDREGTQGLLHKLDQVLMAIVSEPEEPTVNFDGSKASICGLSPINIDTGMNNDPLPDNEAMDEQEEPSSSAEAIAIKHALCQVSRTPPEELSASSTIESIGIDSISAIKVVALLRKQGVKLSVGELVRAKTVGSMAKVAQSKSAASTPNRLSAEDTVSQYAAQHRLAQFASAHGFDESNVQAVLPALPGQAYMLNVWQVTRGQLFYGTFTYRLHGDESETQLRTAWEALVKKHDVMRTVFCTIGNTQVPVAQIVLKTAPDSFTSGETQQSLTTQQPMVHLHANQSPNGWDLELTIHHALYDAVSLPLLMEDLEALVTGKASSEPSAPTISQTDFLALSLSPSAQSSRKDFWTSYLSNAKPLNLRQPRADHAGARVEIFKPAFLSSTRTLEAAARRADLAPQSIIFAAQAKAYARLATGEQAETSGDDVVLGIYLSGRSHFDRLTSLRAPTLNLVPLLIRSASTTPLLEIAKRVQQDLQRIGSPENSAVSLSEIAGWTDVRVDAFVNFLRLPENSHGEEGDREQNKIEVIEGDRLAARSRVTEVNDNDAFKAPHELALVTQHGHDAYLHSLDLEATITPTGSLDVGLFSPADLVNLEQAESVLENLKRELEGAGT